MKRPIIQVHALPRAKFLLNAAEMKVFVYILKVLQASYTEQVNNGYKTFKDLFNHITLKDIHISKIDASMDYKSIKAAIRSLNRQKIIFTNSEYETDVSIIEMPKYWTNKATVEFTINAELVAYLTYYMGGFTKFDGDAIIKLNKYSQRIYMLLCQFSDNGGVYINANEFRECIGLAGKYTCYSHFKKHVIDVAQKEINALFEKGESTLKFEYEKKASKKTSGNDWDRTVTLKVVSYNNKHRASKKIDGDLDHNKNLHKCQFILRRLYDNNNGYFKAINEFLFTLDRDMMLALSLRLDKMFRQISDKGQQMKNNVDAQKIVSKILRDDFGYIKKEVDIEKAIFALTK